jgi:ribonuclease BN (tRNA processing enzyme)
MELVFAGCGSAFCLENWQSNVIIKHDNFNLLVDCGSDIRFALKDLDMSVFDIDAVYISHLHADHIGGLECLAFCTFFCPTSKKPTMFCETNLIRKLWEDSLRGGLEGIEGKLVSLDDYFDISYVEKNGSFIWRGICFDLVQSLHISAKYMILDSFGLLFNAPNGKRIYFTTDSQFAPINNIMKCYEEADIIFHDCETMYKSGVHAHYDSLKTLSKEIKEKMYLYHYQDNVIKEWDAWTEKAKTDGFKGFVKKGQAFKF